MHGVSPMKSTGTALFALGICLVGCRSMPMEDFSSLQAASKPLLASACLASAEVAVDLISNPHVPNLVDRIETRTCGALSVKTYVSTAAADPGGLTMSLQVTRPNHLLPRYMDIGQSVAPLVTKLGEPSSRTDDSMVYSAPESEDSVTFGIAGDRVVSIRWDWPVD